LHMMRGIGQTFGSPPPQIPAVQTDPTVQNSPSSHCVLSAFGLFSHSPVASMQTPSLHTSSSAEQSVRLPATHIPSRQVSTAQREVPAVSQTAPSGRLTKPQESWPSRHAAILHWLVPSGSGQILCCPVHAPATHTSLMVHLRKAAANAMHNQVSSGGSAACATVSKLELLSNLNMRSRTMIKQYRQLSCDGAGLTTFRHRRECHL
jgi:hypothetical protein